MTSESEFLLSGWRETLSPNKGEDDSCDPASRPVRVVAAPDSSSAPIVVPVSRLLPADSPRLGGVFEEHARMLAAVEGPLPPILVHRATMRVVDGMHRLEAATLRGDDTIAVEFFDGNERDLFLHSVRANTTHGLPLTRADREAAISRIIASHPQFSDRAIAEPAGVSAPTVGAIRRRISGDTRPATARIGRDGRIRPLDAAEGRRRAAEVIRDQPGTSLRKVAKIAGISTGTAQDVRERLSREEDPVPAGVAAKRRNAVPTKHGRDNIDVCSQSSNHRKLLEQLSKDPSMRFSQNGRALLQLLGIHTVGPELRNAFVHSIPPHCTKVVAELARESAEIWRQLAEQFERLARNQLD